jgi:hypothetical protein
MTGSLALAINLLLVALLSAAAERHCAYLNGKRIGA